jgi:hypothetical protein
MAPTHTIVSFKLTKIIKEKDSILTTHLEQLLSKVQTSNRTRLQKCAALVGRVNDP